MSNDAERPFIDQCAPDEWDKITELADPQEFLEAAGAYWRRQYVIAYGAEITDLSTDDEALLAAIKSGDRRRQIMAFASLSWLRYSYIRQVVDACADYILCGPDTEVRVLAIGYLGESARRTHEGPITDLLEHCAHRLHATGKSQEDKRIRDCVKAELEILRRWSERKPEIGHPGGQTYPGGQT